MILISVTRRKYAFDIATQSSSGEKVLREIADDVAVTVGHEASWRKGATLLPCLI